MHIFEYFVKCIFFLSWSHCSNNDSNCNMYFSKNSNYIKDDREETKIRPDTYWLTLRAVLWWKKESKKKKKGKKKVS